MDELKNLKMKHFTLYKQLLEDEKKQTVLPFMKGNTDIIIQIEETNALNRLQKMIAKTKGEK